MVKIMNELRSTIVGLLRETKREGILKLVAWMEINGFFTAPCSGGNHLAVEGGLAEHSLNVYGIMRNDYLTKYPSDNTEEMLNSIAICSILHDLGKAGDFGKPNYVENYLKKCDKEGNPIRSESKPYEINKDLLYVPHEVRSISIASQFIQLTEDEYFAILYHNGLYGDFKYDIKDKETVLYMLLHFADLWASRVVEVNQPE
jgi:23S rRNA maturation-related 3'-5' exoribonuclease YhaM